MINFTRWMLAGAFISAYAIVGSFAEYAWSHGGRAIAAGAWAFAFLQWAGVYFSVPPRRVVVAIKGEV